MAKVKFTAGRVDGFKCEDGKTQSFLWCSSVPGLAVRATPGSEKNKYIFQSKVGGKTLRLTIGDCRTWGIDQAQAEARRLQILIDNGDDPRQVKADKREAKEAAAAAKAAQKVRDAVTVGSAWTEYITDRTPLWSARTLAANEQVMQAGGIPYRRSKEKVTQPGALASLATFRLADLTPEAVEDWAKVEAKTRPAQARLALRLLRAFLFWCARHKTYKATIKGNAGQSKSAREILGSPRVKNDVLQKEQLSAWFAAIRQIGSPTVRAYLQGLLLTGARKEELAHLRWADVDFQWNSLTIRDKVEGLRVIPLTPFVASLLAALPRRSEWVFAGVRSVTGRIADPLDAHHKACASAGLDMTLHGLRRSFASLCEWVECPSGVAAQIQGHAPQGVREQNYIRRPLDLLRMWHTRIEAWILEQAGIDFLPEKAGLQLVQNTAA